MSFALSYSMNAVSPVLLESLEIILVDNVNPKQDIWSIMFLQFTVSYEEAINNWPFLDILSLFSVKLN